MDQDALATFKSVWPTIPTQRRRDIMQELVEIGEVNFEVYFDPIFMLGWVMKTPKFARRLSMGCGKMRIPL